MTDFCRLHMPTGQITEGSFDETHDPVFALPFCIGPYTRARMLALIDTWNAQQPTTWKYWTKP